jgi:SAM-dependent methyltransferase
MVDRLFADASLARLYDVLCPGRDDFDFYLPLVMSAESVLDIGCGTGVLLHLARDAGHAGRLCGLDPADAMLAQARRRQDVEWVLGDLTAIGWDREFDLAVMTGHVFQVFTEDDELRGALAAVRAALAEGGRFAFETRNPSARAWERWTPDRVVEVTDDAGAVVRSWHEVVKPVDGDLVTFAQTFTGPSWDRPQVSSSTLRFLDRDSLGSFLAEAGLEVEAQFGDWDRGPVTAASPEIITIVRRSRR